MASDRGNWITDDDDQWADEAQATGKLKGPKAAAVAHTMGMIGHVAHSTATNNHQKGFELDERDPIVRAHDAKVGKLEDWIADREKTGRRRQQLIL